MTKLNLKIPPPIVALLCGLMIWGLSVALPLHHVDAELRNSLAYILLGMAGVIDVWALISFRLARTTIDPRYPHKTSTIVSTGIYRYTRNPMYLGLVFMLSALSIWLGARLGLFAVALFILYINKFQIEPEEKELEIQFGDSYLDYKDRVRRWI
ncbi:isoprenylcysteine carboxylmethyltransferase family protein [Mariprofundus sp. KV]|uniref:methyltransferase family protein n=1 Tax=Mariprofundus sp. KV TaxID=2608715 RepID=UPI0015A13136|nr:isoprenylcysteine carboxylmethyltransferase family protein [Mariprofundus sp. KV]NWF35788.1 isoprenylcysteine carboxylmethyltransferase family protein [Mariprofundus sp. KV]